MAFTKSRVEVMGKKITKVSTADKDMDDADQIVLKEASEVPVSDKKDVPKPEKLVNELPKKDEKPAEPEKKKDTPVVAAAKVEPEKKKDTPVVAAAKVEPEKKKETPAPAAAKEERVSVDDALSEKEEPEVPIKPAKKSNKLPSKKKTAKADAKAKASAKAATTPQKEEDIVVPGLIDDELASPDLVGSMKAQESKPHEAWKILFSGLDFAGKSSIIATVKNEFEKIVNPQPTKLTERSGCTGSSTSNALWSITRIRASSFT